MAFRDHEQPRDGVSDFLVILTPPGLAVRRADREFTTASLVLVNTSRAPPYRVRVAKNRYGNGADHPAIHDLLSDLPTLAVDGSDVIVPSDRDLVLMKFLTS